MGIFIKKEKARNKKKRMKKKKKREKKTRKRRRKDAARTLAVEWWERRPRGRKKHRPSWLPLRPTHGPPRRRVRGAPGRGRRACSKT